MDSRAPSSRRPLTEDRLPRQLRKIAREVVRKPAVSGDEDLRRDDLRKLRDGQPVEGDEAAEHGDDRDDDRDDGTADEEP